MIDGTSRARTRVHAGLVGLYGPLVLLTACTAQTEGEAVPFPALTVQPLINGVKDSTEYDMKLDTVLPDGKGLCTGTLLTNSIVLTAQHCIEDDCLNDDCGVNSGTGTRVGSDKVGVFQKFPAGQSTSRVSVKLEAQPGIDVALVHVDRPFEVAGSTLGFSTQIYGGDPDGLLGKQMRCKGYGGDVCVGTSTVELRYGEMPMNSTTFTPVGLPAMDGLFGTVPNAQNQTLQGGDSGGSCQLVDTSSPFATLPLVDRPILGVNSMCNVRVRTNCPVACGHVKADGFRGWAGRRVSAVSSNQGDNFADPFKSAPNWTLWGTGWSWQSGKMRGPQGAPAIAGMVQHLTAVFNAGVHVDVQGSSSEAAGVFARYRDPNNYTAAYFHAGADVVILFDMRNGQPVILGSGPAQLDWSKGHRISILVNDTHVIAGLEGSQILAAPFGVANHFTSGKAGFFQGSSSALNFDNFNVIHVDNGT